MIRGMTGAMAALLMTVLLAISGCKAPEPEPGASLATPPDFAVEVLYDGDADASANGVQRIKLVLEPDRWLRVAQGTGVRRETFPLRVVRLSLPQVEQLVALMRQAHLQAEPTSPIADKTDLYHGTSRTILHVNITAWTRTNRYATTAQESPASEELFRTLLLMGNLSHLAPPPTVTPEFESPSSEPESAPSATPPAPSHEAPAQPAPSRPGEQAAARAEARSW
jgi:hypothetical protein